MTFSSGVHFSGLDVRLYQLPSQSIPDRVAPQFRHFFHQVATGAPVGRSRVQLRKRLENWLDGLPRIGPESRHRIATDLCYSRELATPFRDTQGLVILNSRRSRFSQPDEFRVTLYRDGDSRAVRASVVGQQRIRALTDSLPPGISMVEGRRMPNADPNADMVESVRLLLGNSGLIGFLSQEPAIRQMAGILQGQSAKTLLHHIAQLPIRVGDIDCKRTEEYEP